MVGRIADGPQAGYHLIDSLVVFAAVADEVVLVPSSRLSVALQGPFAAGLPPGPDNLALKAAQALARWADVTQGARIRLRKHIPIAAGLGGGSADAAAVLRGLNELWRLGAGEAELAALGAKLGADLPTCLAAVPSLVSGYGERVAPAPALPEGLWLVLVNPLVALATSRVFGALRGPFRPGPTRPGGYADAAALAAALGEGRNDLEPPARALLPAIGEVLARLKAAEGCLIARLSGSGATCFGLFAGEGSARAAANSIGEGRSGWWVRATAVLGARLEVLPWP